MKKVKKELKKEDLTTNQLSERLGVENAKIRESIEILHKKGLIEKTGLPQESQERYSFNKSYRLLKIAFPLYIVLMIIFNISMMYLMMNMGVPMQNFPPIYP